MKHRGRLSGTPRPAAKIRRLFLIACLLGALAASRTSAAEGSTVPVLVMVELVDAPASQVYAEALAALPAPSSELAQAAAVAAARQRIARLDDLQRHLAATLTAPPFGAQVIFRLQRVYNGLALRVDPSRMAEIRQLAGVAAVHPVVPKVAANSTSVPFLGTPAVWDSQGLDLTGSGVTMGIVDTGVDYLHTHFSGSGLATDYAANDPTRIDDGFFPNLKVAGGWDFAGDAYDASSPDPEKAQPVPDPDPMDCQGHGTHVAGTAAGVGVEADGSSYDGVYGPATPFASLRIGPGVAPEATLYALRVFGCTGTSAVVEQAIEWAVDPNGDGDFGDHLDVLNLSLTSPYAAADDPTAVAADQAALAGVVVVASAGNDGGQHFITGSPAIAGRAVSVAASWDAETAFPGVGVRVGAPPAIAGTHQAGGAAFGPPLTLTGVSGELVAALPIDACTALENPPGEVGGKVVLIARNPACSAVTQVRRAQQAGAIAVLVGHHLPGLTALPNDGTGGDIVIPALLMRPEAAAVLRSQLPGVVEVTLARVLLGDLAGAFSSRGPRRASPAIHLKPDLAAPGVVITSAGLGNSTDGGTGAKLLSGTSMASPHVAGLLALLRQLHPTWSVAELKALAMNTTADVTFDPELTPPVVGPSHMGAGRIDPAAAAMAGVVVHDEAAPELVGVSFGLLEVTGNAFFERRVRLSNKTVTPATYSLAIRTLSDVPGAEVSLPDGGTVVVPAAGSAEIRLRLTVVRDALRHSHDPALEEASFGVPRHWLSEESGHLLLTPTAGAETVPLRLPFLAVPRPASEMRSLGDRVEVGPVTTGMTTLLLQGRGVETGSSPPLDVVSLVTASELQDVDPLDPTLPLASDLAYVGVGSDFAAQPGGLADTRLFFTVVTHGAWSSPNEVRSEVLLDSDRDGTWDFRLESSSAGRLAFGRADDAFASVLVDLDTSVASLQAPLNVSPPQAFDTVLFHSEVRVLAVHAADLGLTEGASAFDYQVRTRPDDGTTAVSTAELSDLGTSHAGRPSGGESPILVDESRLLTFDPASPGLDFTARMSGPPTRFDLPGVSLPLRFDLAALADQGVLGILLVHHHNPTGRRAEVVALRTLLFRDGFESGGTGAWSSSVP